MRALHPDLNGHTLAQILKNAKNPARAKKSKKKIIFQCVMGFSSVSFMTNGAPEEIRTPGLLIRSQTLYPAELRVRMSLLTDTSSSKSGQTIDELPPHCKPSFSDPSPPKMPLKKISVKKSFQEKGFT